MKTRAAFQLVLALALVTPALYATTEVRTLTLSRTADADVQNAARELAGLISRSGMPAPEVRYQRLFGNPRGIHILTDPLDPRFDRDPLTDEFLVERLHGSLVIRGSDQTTTVHAVYRFAETFLGWRYYQPGPLGLERLDSPPTLPSLDGPEEVLLQSRAGYLSRNLIGLSVPSGAISWGDWHGLRERLVFNHTLHRILPPTRFDTHPEWFAKDEAGKPMRPPYYPRVHGYNDHPDLAHPGVRNWVVEHTADALESQTPFSRKRGSSSGQSGYPPVRQSPGLVSTSISLGDSFVFGSYPEAYPWKPDGYFRGWPDWSNHVFAYSNEVAQALTEIWQSGHWPGPDKPDLLIGVLAYLNWENVPDFDPHPALVPYLTYDRTQWYDAAAREDDLSTVARWNAVAGSFIATWDYTFGYGFFIPRSLVGILSEAIPALHERGVRAYFSQVASLWPFDGHTTWLTARLLWDVERDSAREMEEYFLEFFGPAREPMERFFAISESAWMEVESSGWWLRYWKDPWQVALLDPADMRKMRAALDEAGDLARQSVDGESGLDPRRFQDRVLQVDNLFRMTEALSGYQRLVWELQGKRWETAAPELLEQGLLKFEKAWNKRLELVRLRDQLTAEGFPYGRASDLGWIFRYESFGPVLAEFIEALQDAGKPELLERGRALLNQWSAEQGLATSPAIRPNPPQVLYDTEFQHLDNPRIWHRQLMDSPAMRLVRTDKGLRAENIRRGHVYQLFRAEPGAFYGARAEVSTNQSPSGEVYLKIDFINEDRELLQESSRGRIAPVQLAGEDQRIRMLARAPEGAAYGRVLIRFYEMDRGSSATVRSIGVRKIPSRSP